LAKIKNQNLCKIKAIGDFYPANAQKILATYEKTNCDPLILKMILAVELRFNNNSDFNNKEAKCDGLSEYSLDNIRSVLGNKSGQNVFPWMNDDEWKSIELALEKDKDTINQVGKLIDLEPRLIVSSLVVEQLRLFHSQRALFKKFFEPLKILGNANKISLGVMGIKEATAVQVENNLKDQNSPFYPGPIYENLLNYNKAPGGDERYQRLTSEEDSHRYSYLYGALYLKEMIANWKKSGYDIQYRPEIVGTLFNVGFPQCKPKPDPKVGGSAINVGDAKYSFGSLVYEFYYSGEMTADFPYITE
jgi:hypothetical protein